MVIIDMEKPKKSLCWRLVEDISNDLTKTHIVLSSRSIIIKNYNNG